jgi:hypothetical protein
LQSLPPNGETDFGEDNISQMLEELKEIISKRAEKNISEIHFNNNRTTTNNNDQINKASTTTNNNSNKTNNKNREEKRRKV